MRLVTVRKIQQTDIMPLTVEKYKQVPYSIGQQVMYKGRSDYGVLRSGDLVTVTAIEDGMFPPDIYVTVKTANGLNVTGYHWRFVPTKETRIS